jgi:hypothetical protein
MQDGAQMTEIGQLRRAAAAGIALRRAAPPARAPFFSWPFDLLSTGEVRSRPFSVVSRAIEI